MSRLSDLEDTLLRPAEPGLFAPEELDGLPDAVRRYFLAAIEPGTPLAKAARLRMKGHIKVKRWLPFRARQVLSPHHGFVWAGRAGGVIAGSDSFVEGRGSMDWKVAGRFTVAHAEGPDVSRSAAGRAAAEAIWLPIALLPRFGVGWSEQGPNAITASYEVGGFPVELHLELDGEGHLQSAVFDRWGDPENSGRFSLHPFGGHITRQEAFDGLTIPAAGSFGWYFGTDRWVEGEFFRYEIVSYQLVK
ncbi:MAG TPA: DUF6544 family protein [Actinomycetota bacterium]|nr:DUF6544 family protein [Actinomycetota bacterium]